MKSPNPRFCLVDSKLRNSKLLFDKLLEEPAVEIATNSEYHNELIGKACLLIMGDKEFRRMVEEWEQH